MRGEMKARNYIVCMPSEEQLSGYIVVEHIGDERKSRKEETIDIFIILTTNLHHIFVKIIFTSSHQPPQSRATYIVVIVVLVGFRISEKYK